MKNICIIGYGRFGALLADILAPYGNIFVISRQHTLDKHITRITYKDLNTMDVVIPAVPISKLKKVLQHINPYLKPQSLVMDVCSVKVLPCQWLRKYVRKDVYIIGSHPFFGPDSAQEGLEGLQIVICPLRVSREILKEIKVIFRSLGLRITQATPKEHDKQAARSLSLVHFLGRALGKMHIGQQEISTLGYERLLLVNETVNNDSWQLFYDMHRYNPYAKKERQRLIKVLNDINQKILL